MKQMMIVGLLVALVAVSGCVERPDSKSGVAYDKYYEELAVLTFCEDGIVCYYHSDSYDGGMGCFRDKELEVKYCG